jgi:hypothetical protein
MNQHDAKFLLSARRPGNRDAADPVFAEALAEAQRAPALQAWLEGEQRLDTAIAGKLAEISPPAGLRESILAGANVSRRRSSILQPILWLAAAAGVAVLMTLAGRFNDGGRRSDAFAEAAIRDLMQAHDEHVGYPAELIGVQERLATTSSLRANMPLDLDELQRSRCRTVRIAGHAVFEVCFQRDGVWYHLYARRGSGTPARDLVEKTQAGGGVLVATAWSDGKNSYALVTNGGRDALQRVL